MWGPILALVGIGAVAVIVVVFWADLQNWMAGVIERARATLGPLADTLQSALVILDRTIVNGQRVISLTGRALFHDAATGEVVAHEEVRSIDPQALPADVLARLERGETVHYEL